VIESRDPRLINVLGALAMALADGLRDATEAAAGMTGAAPAALVALHQFLAGRPAEDLAQATGLTHSGAVRLIDRLVDAGLVERRPGRDARSLSIVLTPRGRALSRKVTVVRAAVIEAALAGRAWAPGRPEGVGRCRRRRDERSVPATVRTSP